MNEIYDQARCNEEVSSAFGNGLAATIIAAFPIASIVAIVLGNRALKTVENVRAVCLNQPELTLGRKNRAAKVLGLVGKILGIVMTVFWPIYIGLIAAIVYFAIRHGTVYY